MPWSGLGNLGRGDSKSPASKTQSSLNKVYSLLNEGTVKGRPEHRKRGANARVCR